MGKGFSKFYKSFTILTHNCNHPNWYVLAKLPNNPDSKAVSYDIMDCTYGLSLISALCSTTYIVIITDTNLIYTP